MSRTEGERPSGGYAHPTAVVEPGVELAAGVKVWHFCHVRQGCEIGEGVSLGQGCHVAPGVKIGRGSRIQNHVSLYEGVVLEEEVFVGPSVVFTNVLTPRAHVSRKEAYEETRVGRGASIGANATIVCGVRIGAYAMIGAGSVVTRDVPAHALMVGNPARQRGWCCGCGEVVRGIDVGGGEGSCERCGRAYRVGEGEARLVERTPE